jgi:hypothetical protein
MTRIDTLLSKKDLEDDKMIKHEEEQAEEIRIRH